MWISSPSSVKKVFLNRFLLFLLAENLKIKNDPTKIIPAETKIEEKINQ
jgi:hypothetical protein